MVEILYGQIAVKNGYFFLPPPRGRFGYWVGLNLGPYIVSLSCTCGKVINTVLCVTVTKLNYSSQPYNWYDMITKTSC